MTWSWQNGVRLGGSYVYLGIWLLPYLVSWFLKLTKCCSNWWLLNGRTCYMAELLSVQLLFRKINWNIQNDVNNKGYLKVLLYFAGLLEITYYTYIWAWSMQQCWSFWLMHIYIQLVQSIQGFCKQYFSNEKRLLAATDWDILYFLPVCMYMCEEGCFKALSNNTWLEVINHSSM